MYAMTMVSLDVNEAFWGRVFLVAPLVVIGTREGDGFDLAPKHMAMPMGWGPYFGFICTPAHGTWHNAIEHGCFTVSYPRPDQLAEASLTASPRAKDSSKPILADVSTIPASVVDGVFLEGASLMLECEFDRVVEDLGSNGLIIGRVVAAHARPEALRISDADHQQQLHESPLLAYIHPDRYGLVRETTAFPFPAEMRR